LAKSTVARLARKAFVFDISTDYYADRWGQERLRFRNVRQSYQEQFGSHGCVFGTSYDQIHDWATSGCALSRLIIELLANNDGSLGSDEHVLGLCMEGNIGSNCKVILHRIPLVPGSDIPAMQNVPCTPRGSLGG
jgi:hypothetical protein